MTRLATLLLLAAITAPVFGQQLEVKRAHYSVFYDAGSEKDAAFVAGWMDRAEQLMKDKYGVAPRHYRLSVRLYGAPTPQIDVNTARIHCCSASASGDSTGTIEMLAPSAAAFKTVTAISSLGMPKNDESYHAKILTSEYIPIGHYEVQNARIPGGWKYYSAPNWFVQGLQEYDAIFHTTERNRDSTGKRLSAWATAHPGAFTCCSPELAISDAYNGGASFLAFLAAEFGEDVHARLLRSPASTFWAALSDETKVPRAELFSRLQQWLRDGAPVRR